MAEADIVGNGAAEQILPLRQKADRLAQEPGIELAIIQPIDKHGSGLGQVELGDDLQKVDLPAPTWSGDRQKAVLRRLQRDAAQGRLATRRIAHHTP